jgi:hypothetical protein
MVDQATANYENYGPMPYRQNLHRLDTKTKGNWPIARAGAVGVEVISTPGGTGTGFSANSSVKEILLVARLFLLYRYDIGLCWGSAPPLMKIPTLLLAVAALLIKFRSPFFSVGMGSLKLRFVSGLMISRLRILALACMKKGIKEKRKK